MVCKTETFLLLIRLCYFIIINYVVYENAFLNINIVKLANYTMTSWSVLKIISCKKIKQNSFVESHLR